MGRKKSVIMTGLFVLFLIFFSVRLYSISDKELSEPKSVYIPRYSLVFSPHARADTFLVDGEYGRVWQLVENEELGLIFKELYVENNLYSKPYREEYDRIHKIKHRIR